MIGSPADETNFPYKLLLTNRQVSNVSMDFGHNSSANIVLSKIQIFKIIQPGGFLGRLLGTLMKVGLSLMKNVIKPLAKGALIPSAANVGIHKSLLAREPQL